MAWTIIGNVLFGKSEKKRVNNREIIDLIYMRVKNTLEYKFM